VEVRITPEPEERDAVLAAIEALLLRDSLPPAYQSGWRLRGVLENVDDDDDDQADTGLPRSSPGATRA
jgi:hypothetical protein